MKRQTIGSWPAIALVTVLWAFAWPVGLPIQAAEATQSSPAFEEYRQQTLKSLGPARQKAERAARIETITNLVHQFKTSGNSSIVRVLAEGNYAPDEIVPVLDSLLDYTNAQAQTWILLGLRRYGTNAAQSAPKVLAILKGTNDALAAQAAETMVAIAPARNEAVPVIIAWLESGRGNLTMRLAWIGALRDMGTRAAAALPALMAEVSAQDMPFLTNRSSISAYAAFQAIGSIRSQPPLAREELLRRKIDAFLGEDAYRSLQAVKEGILSKDEALPLLHELLNRTGNLPQRIMSAEILADLRPRDSQSIGRLLSATRQRDSEFLADTASAALAQCIVADTNSVTLLTAALDPNQPTASLAASRALVRSVEVADASAVVDGVLVALDQASGQTDFQVIGGLLDILRKFGPRAAQATPSLTKLLPVDAPIYQGRTRSTSMFVRKYVLLTLADVGITADALPAIVDELVNAAHLENVAAAARAAGALPERQEVAVPHLISALTRMRRTNDASALNLNVIGIQHFSPDVPVTSMPLEVIRALVRIGPAAKPAVPVLRARAADPPVPASRYYLSYHAEAAQAAEILSK